MKNSADIFLCIKLKYTHLFFTTNQTQPERKHNYYVNKQNE